MTRHEFPYPPGDPTGDWVVTLPGEASIGELIVYASPIVALGGWLAYRAAVIADGPEFYWTFEDTGDRGADQSGNGNDVTAVGGTPLYDDTDGPGAGPLVGWSNATDYLELASASWMDTNGQSVECWVRSPSGVAAQGELLNRDNGSGRYWVVYKDSDDDLAAYSNNSTGPVFNSTGDIATGGWHHIVWTWDWASGVRTGAIYIDGTPDSTQAAIGLISSGSCPIRVGASNVHNTRTDIEIAHPAVYAYRLSAGQVAAHYAAMF